MKRSTGSPHRLRKPAAAKQRAQLLAAFDRSGLSSAAFARKQGLNYTTFCGWRHRRAKAKPSPEFVQVELSAPAAPVELLIDLGASARLRLTSTAQIELAARLLQQLNTPASC
jgi:hypothetical protein